MIQLDNGFSIDESKITYDYVLKTLQKNYPDVRTSTDPNHRGYLKHFICCDKREVVQLAISWWWREPFTDQNNFTREHIIKELNKVIE